MYTADQMCNMVDFLADNIFVKFWQTIFLSSFFRQYFSQVIGIPIGTNCAPFLADLFLYSDESEFLDSPVRSGHRKLDRSFI